MSALIIQIGSARRQCGDRYIVRGGYSCDCAVTAAMGICVLGMGQAIGPSIPSSVFSVWIEDSVCGNAFEVRNKRGTKSGGK